MIVKGIVSAINIEEYTVDVILPEYEKIVVKTTPYRENLINSLEINDFVLVVVFNNNFTDCMII